MATNSMLTPVLPSKPKGKKPKANVTPKDQAFDRNFTTAGKPKLNASVSSGTGEGSMGQRR